MVPSGALAFNNENDDDNDKGIQKNIYYFLGIYYILDSFKFLNSQVLWTNYKTNIIIFLDMKTQKLTNNK